MNNGEILLDGVNIKDINVNSLRSHIGLVTQEPILFADTVKENIKAGIPDGQASDEQVDKALKEANARDFIYNRTNFPRNIETHLGDKGLGLSGGQKQRIAIARALISQPKILLLDEATSALDAESEKIVQDALDRASAGRTTIIIAHRLSTVRNADRIFGIRDGQVVEVGSHDELIANENGLYRALVDAQTRTEDAEQRKEAQDEMAVATLERQGSTNKALRKNATEMPGKDDIDFEDDTKFGEDLSNFPEVKFAQILPYMRPEVVLIIISAFFSILAGAAEAGFAVVFAEVVSIYAFPSSMGFMCWV